MSAGSSGLVDTSVWISRELARTLDDALLPEFALVSIVTIGELRSGVLAAASPATRAARLATLERARQLDPLPIDDAVAEAWALLRSALAADRRRMPVNDSWIAATALAHRLPVFTQDDDYDGVPGLSVVKV